MVDVLGEKTVTARKTYVCPMCERPIKKGQAHHTQRCADGSRVWTWRAHTECFFAYPDYLAWCGWGPHEMDDNYGETDAQEFRSFLAERTSHKADSDG